jgi:MYXO-CTERM domain-containing protein
VPVTDGTICSDGDLCTVDVCTAGTCGSTPLDCSAEDSTCTVGSCNAATGVCEAVAANDGGACDDGDLCTTTDVCAAGVCGGASLDCSGLDGACLVGTCNATTGACEAVAANEGGACDDGDLCTTTDVCAAGVCGGSTLDCSGLDSACAVGSCNATTGTCEAIAANEGQACDDGDLCTTTDVCAAGVCGGAATSCANLDSACQVGMCDALTGECVAQNLENGSACDDDSACTENDACTDGVCSGTAVPAGTACGDQCNAGICDGETGTCSQSPLADGTACDDNDPCTVTDVCTAGACGGAPAEDGTACDDGDECTDQDTCVAGVCTAGQDICMMADVGPDAGDDAGTPDAGTPDAGDDAGTPDAGQDAGDDSGQPVGPITSGNLEGSGCSSSGAPFHDAGLLLGLLGLIALRRRRD